MRLVLLGLLGLQLYAQSTQRFHELRDLRLESGSTLARCRVGYRTYGKLNAEGNNAVLWPTWFSGRSEQLEPYFGPGKVVDTDRYYVVAVDALGNGVSCSPSNGGPDFPELTIRDMVESQYRLLREALGVKRLRAVIGISMGGMQTYEWLIAHPEFVEKAVPVVGSPRLSTPDLLLWQAELETIEAVRQAGGDGRSAMPAVLTMHQFALTTPAHHVREEPATAFSALKQRLAADAARGMDPRDWAAQLKAMMKHDISRRYGGSLEKAGAAIAARVLVIVATQDHMVNPATSEELARSAGLKLLRLEGDCGHLAPGCELARWSQAVDEFLR